MILTKKCQQCGVIFEKPYSISRREWETSRKYCSRQCLSASKIGKPSWNKGKPGLVGSANPNYKGPKQCEVCGVDFKRTFRSRRFCSITCAYKGRDQVGFEKGIIPWNKGLVGVQVAWNKGLPRTWEATGSFKKGQKAWNKGKQWVEMRGENSPHWKGNKAGLVAQHSWIKRQKGYAKMCVHCKFESDNHHLIHWANISGEYRRDVNDYMSLCATCHKKYDLQRTK